MAGLAVVRTPPGSAHVVASALDRGGVADILAPSAATTVLLVVATEVAGGSAEG